MGDNRSASVRTITAKQLICFQAALSKFAPHVAKAKREIDATTRLNASLGCFAGLPSCTRAELRRTAKSKSQPQREAKTSPVARPGAPTIRATTASLAITSRSTAQPVFTGATITISPWADAKHASHVI